MKSVGRFLLTTFAYSVVFPVMVGVVVLTAGPWALLLPVLAGVVALVGLVRPLSHSLVDRRWKSVVLLMGAIFCIPFALQEKKLSELRRTDPSAYLEEIRTSHGEERWLKEARELDPEAYEAEVTRRKNEELEQAARKKAELIEAEQEQREARRREAAERERRRAEAAIVQRNKILEQVQREVVSVGEFDPRKYTESRDTILIAAALFGAWAKIIDDAQGHELTDEEKALVDQLKSSVRIVQRKSFPVLRDAMGPIMRKALWEHDISARTIGTGYRVFEFTGAVFAANRGIKAFNDGIWETIQILRFKQTRYRWYKGADEYTYFEQKNLGDEDIILWHSGGGYRVVR